MLLDAHGVPLFLPALFVTSQLRNAGAAVNTIKNKLADVEVLLRWESEQARNLVEEFAEGRFLTLADISSLRDFAQLNMRDLNRTRRQVAALKRAQTELLEAHVAFVDRHPVVGTQQHYNRMSTIADYLEFVGIIAVQDKKSSSDVNAVASMAQRIRQHRPRGTVHSAAGEPHERSLSPELVARFMAVAQVDHSDNPFRDPGIRQRNAILFGLLRYTGMRRGELLSLRIDQFDLGNEPEVWVRRNQDDVHDSRRYQPVTKTKERPLPLPRSLADQIQDYIVRVRVKIGVSRKHPYLFISHKKGRTCGAPLSEAAVGSQIMPTMRGVDPEFRDIYPHNLRHHFNYELSLRIDVANGASRRQPFNPSLQPISASQELDIRAFANGHRSKASGAAYNQRHIRERADVAIRQIQNGMTSSALEKDDDRA
jgi:integrase